jgi:hypothetical protein
MRQTTNTLQTLLDHPRVALIFALILGGIALSGRFSVIATRIVFLLAWLVAVFSFYGFSPIRSRTILFVACSVGFGLCLTLLGTWARPESVPLNFGRIAPHRSFVLWSGSEPDRMLQIGDSGVFFKNNTSTDNFSKSLHFLKQSDLVIERQNKSLKVSVKVRNVKGDLVAEMIRNEWKVSSSAWDKNYTDDALEIRDSRGLVVLQVRVLPDVIQLQGEWWDESGHGMKMAKCILPDGSPGGCVVLMNPQYQPQDPIIEPIFQYPSDLHFGELRR